MRYVIFKTESHCVEEDVTQVLYPLKVMLPKTGQKFFNW